jgi:flagella basal body P-ring formation protein FlgA
MIRPPRNSERSCEAPKGGAIPISIGSLIRALPFVGALVVGLGSPRFAFAQSNGTRVGGGVPSQQQAMTVETPAPKQRVAVATHVIPRGTALSADDFEMRDTTLRMSGSQPDTTPVVAGWVTRRLINAGEILRSPAVEAPAIVNANAAVLIEWSDGNVSLTVHGIAARNGALGDRIPVRSDLGKRFEATVVAPGRVRID